MASVQAMRVLSLPRLLLLTAMIARVHLPAIIQTPKHSPPVILNLSEIDGPEWPLLAALYHPPLLSAHVHQTSIKHGLNITSRGP